MQFHVRLAGIVAATLSALCVHGGPAMANVVQSTIIGVFGGTVTSGYVLHNPNLASTTFFNNAGTAVYAITNGTNPALAGTPPLQATGSSLVWGDNNGGSGAPSILNFFGAPIPANVNQSFQLGRITYSNGTSSLASLIFGATISFYDGSVSAVNFLGTDTIVINTTSNLGQSVAQDSDYINICGNQSNICQNSIEAVESSQGGTGVTVDLFGTIVGDPQLFVNLVTLVPGQSPTTNGFIGTDPPLAMAPEPPALTLLCGGLAALFMLRRRMRG